MMMTRAGVRRMQIFEQDLLIISTKMKLKTELKSFILEELTR